MNSERGGWRKKQKTRKFALRGMEEGIVFTKLQSKSAAAFETFFPPQPQHTIVGFPSSTKPQLHTNSQRLTPVSSVQPEKKEGKEWKEEKKKEKEARVFETLLQPSLALPFPGREPPHIMDRPIWTFKNLHDALLASADCSRASVEIAVWCRRQNKSHERTKKGRKERTFLFAPPPVWEKYCWERVDCVPRRARTSTLTDHVT